MGATPSEIRRVDFGSFVRPPEETTKGVTEVAALLGYVVIHPQGIVLFDTGMGHPDEETERHYRPARVPLDVALATSGIRPDQVTMVVNCHLHFDHCGGNPSFTGRPIACQRQELADARSIVDYTLPDLVDNPGLSYLELDGDAELLPGVHVWPTPGHTAGHQSLVVRLDDGTVVLAGQSHPGAAAFSADLERRDVSEWLPRLLALDPRRVLFAHDGSVWEPS
jgi:N-acyl homoserine lactone hydrolase